jgi:hypothetical protein
MTTNSTIEMLNPFAELLKKYEYQNFVAKEKEAIEIANNVLYVDFFNKQKISKMEWEMINLK